MRFFPFFRSLLFTYSDRKAFAFCGFLTGFLLGLYLCIYSVEHSNYVDCDNGYLVRIPLACPSVGLS